MSKRSLFVRLVPCRCLRGEEEAVTSLDYSHCSLEAVPKEVFGFEKTLTELYLDANQIEELPKQLFNCQLLQRLSLPDNDLTVLPAAIANLLHLRELDVSKNSIQEFPENIKNCKVLTVVEASVNPISRLPDGFTQLLSLTQLYLNDAFLEFLPASFGRLTKLQILELRENQLKMLPKSMHKLTQLERLDLGSNEFTEVPEVLEQLTGIKELWMDGNRLTFLPGMLGSLKQLSYLDVSKNSLEMVDEQICGCENLQDLLLSNNALTQLPGSIGSLKRLSALKVDENQLMYLPDSVGGLSALDELDCSFNEIEALPSSIGQCGAIRTFAADHNFLSVLPPEMGNWKNATVLFLHSNKLEGLPEEMGDMHKLKVVNLSNNKLRNLPYSFTRLHQLTAMWLSENQSKPLIPLQKEEDPETHKTVLTNYMFPQQTRTEDYVPSSDSESFNPALWEEQRKQRAQVAFECDEDQDERETPPREGNLKRYPTPYPGELKSMVKTAQCVAHRLREDESGGEAARNPIGVQAVGVKVIEAPDPDGSASDAESQISTNTSGQNQNPSATEPKDTSDSSGARKAPSGPPGGADHEDTLDSDELSDEEEEMKMAEMRPPLIQISINAPKVVTLSKEAKDDADSLLDDTVANSNQNNSNCSSPSRMSDSVSLTTDSSQDDSLGTRPFLPESRLEDQNMNRAPASGPPLHNGNGSESSLQALLKSPPDKMADYDLSLAFMEKRLDNGVESYGEWDQINMNVSGPPADNTAGSGDPVTPDGDDNVDESLLNGNRRAANGDTSLSRSSEELSPGRRGRPGAPAHSGGHTEAPADSGGHTGGAGLKLYSFDGDGEDSYDAAGGGARGQSVIVRSKSASQLGAPPAPRAPPGSSASSLNLLCSAQPPPGRLPPPQYNVQYSSSGVPREALWRTAVPPEGCLAPPPHSLANTNYSNRNQAPPYALQQRPPPPPVDMWTRERPPPRSATLQRQSSSASTASVDSAADPRRGDYLTYRDIHTLARGPLAMSHAMQRPLSARTYSVDVPGAPPRSLGPSGPRPRELPERTVSVSDFHHQQGGGPAARPGARSEHSLLDGPGVVPPDWRDQVMRHIEAKKMEKDDVFPQGQQSYSVEHHRQGPLLMARHASREQLIDYLMLKVSHGPPGAPRAPQDALQQEIHVKMEKNPELGFSISGGVGGRGNPFRPDDNGIFVTRVQPEGPASMILQPGDKILQANGYNFVNIDHLHAVSLLKTFPNTVDMLIVREASA
ncbi:erbin isoform X2 [Pseudoliparis swirei]|uniref:erbin isoform X2 n=1 Tax=Pseudoliparis swirei TaxID=2059687 RepID=UPI0024BE70C6|nr:erbin isoform X2 [Pseudoliparis swirei]